MEGFPEHLSAWMERVFGGPDAVETVPEVAAALWGALEDLPDRVVLFDREGRVVFVTHPFDDDPPERLWEAAIPADRPMLEALVRELLAGGAPTVTTVRGLGPGGREAPYRTRLLPLRDRTGAILAGVCVLTDRSDEERVLADLRRKEARLRLALEAAEVGLWEAPDVGRDEVILDERAASIYGLQPDAVHRGLQQVVHPDDVPELEKRVGEMRASASRRLDVEHRVVRGDGEVVWVRGRGLVVPLPNGEQSLVGTLQDITAERAAGRARTQSEKLAAVGQLASGVAHNFNNMLAAILGHLELAATGTPEEAADGIEAARGAALRASWLVRELLTFTGHTGGSKRVQSLEPLLRRVHDLCRGTFGRDVDIALVTPDSPTAPVRVDEGQIQQAILNLTLNARDAILGGQRGGCVTLRLVGAEDHVRIEVEDDGPGVPREAQDHLFEPFFTTKEVGGGTGLGLSSTYAILEEHGGRISFDSEPGRTVFRLELPVAPGRPVAPSEEPRASDPLPGQHAVLLAEDEALIRRSVRRILERAGFRTAEAESGEAALERLAAAQAAHRPFDLVLLDLSMPGIGGRALLEELSGRPDRPALVVYSGGLVEDLDVHADAVLRKPVQGPTLVATLKDVIARRSTGG
jgi:two-component system cell cycle sensor histidine kinase/response regulator CckA